MPSVFDQFGELCLTHSSIPQYCRIRAKTSLNKKYGAICCDMESAGILLSSQVAGVPCFMLKTVSDGKGGAEEYLKTVHTASEICANLILDIIG